jgi:SAM-dependent methyltransferase
MSAVADGAVLPPLKRREHAGEELRAREREWWARYGQVEERYFWGMQHSWQPLARKRYLETMAKLLAGTRHVVDYGCGNGWVARIIAEHIQAPVTGVDFSEEQIALANAASGDNPWTLFAQIEDVEELPIADGYILHGVLHHLTAHEIHGLLDRVATRCAAGSKVVLVEPCCFPGHGPDARDRVLLDLIDELVREPARAAAAAGVAEPDEIGAVRAAGDERWWGEIPYGPSPMERPFERDELSALAHHYFDVHEEKLVQFLPASQGLAGQLALVAEYAPDVAQAIATPLLWQMDVLERALLRMPEPPDAGWYMTLVSATVR